MGEAKSECLIVLGMHRSGTSVLAGCLAQLGVELGEALMPASASNEAGYFEHTDLVLVHDLLFRELDYRWHFVGSLPLGWLESKATQRAKQRILYVVDRDFQSAPLWAVKEPRMCRLIPLWLEVFAEREIQPKFVLVIRQPLEVAQSLHKRDGFDLRKGHLMWLTYNREALLSCRGFTTAVVSYDQLLANPIHTLESLGRTLDVAWPIDPRTINSKILAFVQARLKHHSLGSTKLEEQETFDSFATLYDLMLHQASSADFAAKLSLIRDSNDMETVSERPLSGDGSFFPLTLQSSRSSSDVQVNSAISGILSHMQDLISQYECNELAQSLLREQRLLTADHQAYLLYLQVFFPNPNESEKVYTEERSYKVLLVPNEWQQITVDIPDSAELQKRPLRLDPLNTMGMIWISALHLVNASTGQPLWSATAETGFSGCEEMLNLLIIDRTEVLMLASIGTDPIMKLPIMDELPEVPLRLKMWIKVDRNLLTLSTAWRVRDASLKTKEQEIKVRQQHTNDLENQLDAMAEANKLKESENKKLTRETETQAKSIQERDNALEELESENKKLTRETETQAKSIEERFQELAVLTKMLEKTEGDLQAQERNVTVYQERVNGLENELGEKSGALNATKIQLAETKAQLNKAQEATDSMLAELRSENKELKSELQIQAKKLEDCFKELATLTRLLVERDSVSLTKERETSIEQQPANKPSQKKPEKRWWENSFTRVLKKFVWTKLIKKSGLFDSEWYLKQYPDVVKHKGGPVDHYIRHGAAEGLNPGPDFDAVAYLRKYPDVADIGINPLVHYVQYGKAEGRVATKLVDKG